jgi:hypothetical protein
MDDILTYLKESWNILEQEQELDELLIHGNPKQGTNVIAYNKHLWVLPDTVSNKVANDIILFLLPSRYAGAADDDFPFTDESFEVRSDEIRQLVYDAGREDILTGWLKDSSLTLNNGGTFKLDPKSSLLVKKVANALRVKKVIYQDDMEGNSPVSIPRKKLTAQVADIGFHGTSIKYLEDILKVGLVPMGHQSNYKRQGVYHYDKIFFATRFGEASQHAIHTSTQTKSLPIVLEFMIHNKDLVISDYDVDMSSGATTYDEPSTTKHTKYGNANSFAMSKEFGVYGYIGKILPQHIKYVYILFKEDSWDAPIKDYKKLSPLKLKKFLDRHGSFDELIYYVK